MIQRTKQQEVAPTAMPTIEPVEMPSLWVIDDLEFGIISETETAPGSVVNEPGPGLSVNKVDSS